MREILFRGKSSHNGKWVEGYLGIEVGKIPYIQWLEYDDDYHEDVVEECAVDPETVGQYTGLTDKNGKKIFEGDIVQIYDPDGLPAVVRYDDGETMFAVVIDNIFYGLGEHFTKNDLTIIGNIYDNSELLER